MGFIAPSLRVLHRETGPGGRARRAEGRDVYGDLGKRGGDAKTIREKDLFPACISKGSKAK